MSKYNLSIIAAIAILFAVAGCKTVKDAADIKDAVINDDADNIKDDAGNKDADCADHCTTVENDDSLNEPPEYNDEAPRPFRFTVRTCKSEKYEIPLVGAEDFDVELIGDEINDYHIDYDLDCDGDGVYEKTHQTGNVICDLAPGSHHIAIRGTIPGIQFDTGSHAPNSDCLKKNTNSRVVSLDQWGDIQWRNLSKMFSCENADIYVGTSKGGIKSSPDFWNGYRRYYNAKDVPDLKYIRRLSCVGCAYTDYRGSFEKWDVSGITNMSYMFSSISRFDVCNSCNTLNGEFNQDISGWNTSNVRNMSGMFYGCHAFNQPIGKWNTSNVTDMSSMFYDAGSFNQPIGKWDTSNVTDMSDMFADALAFNQPIASWNISSVESMRNMFYEAWNFQQDLSKWDVKNIITNDMLGCEFDKKHAPKNYIASSECSDAAKP